MLIFRYAAGIELISYENERENSSGTVSQGGCDGVTEARGAAGNEQETLPVSARPLPAAGARPHTARQPA